MKVLEYILPWKRSGKSQRRTRSCLEFKPRIEQLEDRCTPATLAISSTDVPKSITAGPHDSIIDVGQVGWITDVNVQVNISHTWDSDLDVFLYAPDGTGVELFTDVGSSGDNFTNTILDDEAGTAITAGFAPFASSYRPEGNLSALDGTSMTGQWQLRITDDNAVAFTGTLNSWSLTIEYNTSPSVTIYSANMDVNPGWTLGTGWAYGAPAGLSGDPASGFSGSNVIGYNLSGDYTNSISSTRYATTPAVDCSDYSDVTLSFRRWLGIESSTFDQANIQVSNNGSTWTTVWQHSGATVNEATWSLQTYNISTVADGQPTVYLRWGLGPTDLFGVYHGWNIDDVVVSGIAIGPAVTTQSPAAGALVASSSVNVDVTFSAPVFGVDATDLVLSGSASGSATVGSPTNVAGNTWRFPISGLATGTLNLSLASDPNDIEDGAGNDLVPGPTTWSYTVDITPPAITAANPVAGAVIVTPWANIDVTFSEAVVGIDATDLVLGGLAAAGAIVGTPTDMGGDTWRFRVSGLVNGALDLSLAPDPNDIEDAAGNDLAPSPTQWSYTVDVAPPTIMMTNPIAGDVIVTPSVNIDVTFSNAVVGVDVTDVVLGGSAASAATVGAPKYLGGNTWRFAVSGLVNGTLDVSLAPDPGDIQGATGYDLAPSPTLWSYAVVLDTTAPVVTSTTPLAGATITAPFSSVVLTFSETVVNVDATDLVLSGAAAAGATVGTPIDLGGNTWAFPISDLSDGALSIDLAPDSGDIRDLAGNDLGPLGWSCSVALGTGWSVTNLGDTVDANPGDGVVADASGEATLRAAVMEDNALAGPDTIFLGPGQFELTLAGDDEDGALTGDLDITGDLTIRGAGQGVTIIDANLIDRIFHVRPGATVTLQDLTITGGYVIGFEQGGGILNDGGDLTLSRVTITDMFLAWQGGGIYNAAAGSLSIADSIISNNRGGGIHNLGSLSITNSVFAHNRENGAIVNLSAGLVTISGSRFEYNEVLGFGTGGIEHETGTLQISDSTFTGNIGGAISNDGGVLEIARSTFTRNWGILDGGAITSKNGVLVLTESTIDGNRSSSSGGGIDVYSNTSVTIVRSTISNNATVWDGGGVTAFANLQVDIEDTTISGNSALTYGGGIYQLSGPVTISNSTITGNTAGATFGGGGGIDANATLNLHNVIVAGNRAASGRHDIEGTVASQGYNLIGNTTGTTITGVTTGNILGVDPLLGPLADNGGPTWTHALLPGSPAIDAGDNAGSPPTDQRGVLRPVGGTVDIGAYEVSGYPIVASVSPGRGSVITTSSINVDIGFSVPVFGVDASDLVLGGSAGSGAVVGTPIALGGNVWRFPVVGLGEGRLDISLAPDPDDIEDAAGWDLEPAPSTWSYAVFPAVSGFVVNSTLDSVDANPGNGISADSSGASTLRAAIMEANALAGNDTILLGPGRFGLYLAGTGEDGAATGDLDITGNLAIRGAGVGITVVDANLIDRVFHIRPGATVVFEDLSVMGGYTSAAANGLGIFDDGGTLTVLRSEVAGNFVSVTGTGSGGGIYNTASGTLTIADSIVSNNEAYAGGGLYNQGQLIVLGSTFSDNFADNVDGGAIANHSPATTVIMGSTVTYNDNSRIILGTGGIEHEIGALALIDCIFVGNTGGAVSNNNGGTLEVTRSTFIANRGDDEAGAINSRDGILTVTESTVTRNQSADVAGGLYLLNNPSAAIVASTINDNSSSSLSTGGGGIHASGNTAVAITNTTVSGNTGDDGAGVYVASGYTTLVNSTVSGNLALGPFGGDGGGIQQIGASSLSLSNTIVAGNWAASGPHDFGGTLTSQGYNLIGNTTGTTITGVTTGNLLGVDPLLGPLADNGGPTWTHALLSGSPAVNAGNNTGAPATDQRGAARPVGGVVDIGAFEFGGIVPTGDTTRPTVIAQSPLAGSALGSGWADVYVTFSEPVIGVDASDLVLGGAAAAGASVGAPELSGGTTWRFPISGLANGTFDLALAPDANDIVDGAGNDLDPRPTQWSYVVNLPLLTLTLAASSISEIAGSGATTGTVTRGGDVGLAAIVMLNNSDGTEISIPASVTIPAGQASATFAVDAVDDTVFDGTQLVTITASAAGYVAGNTILSVTDYETLSLSLPAATVAESAGPSALLVTVTRNNTDLASPVTVNLSSSDLSEATVPASVTIVSGQPSAFFFLGAVDETILDGDQTVTITATAASYAAGVAILTVTDHETLSLTVPASIAENNLPAVGTVARGNSDITSPLVVNLISSDTSQATVPSQVTIPGSWALVTFAVTAVDDTLLDGTQAVTISATAAGYVGSAAPIEVTDHELLVVNLATGAVAENAGPAATTGTLTRGNTDISSDLVVSLSSNNTAATVPAQVTIPGGVVSATFTVAVIDDTVLDGPQSVIIRALAAGYPDGLAGLLVSDHETLSVDIAATAIAENAGVGAAAGTVTRGNTDVAAPLVVNLASSDSSELIVPAQVTIPAGQSSATFSVTAVDDAALDGTQRVTMTTTAAGYVSGTDWLDVTDYELVSLVISPTTVLENAVAGVIATVSRDPADVTNPLVVNLATSDPGEATVPPTVTIPGGAAWATFAINAVDDAFVDSNQQVTISATATGYTGGSAILVVADDEVPALLAPAGTTQEARPTFLWSQVQGAARYDIWIDDVTARQSPLYRDQFVTGTSWSLPAALTPGHTYRWWVRAHDAGGTAGQWSQAQVFYVALASPVPLAPAGTVILASPTFTWSAVAGANHYDVWVDGLSSGQSQVLRNQNVAGTAYAVATALTPGRSYRWWVRAVGDDGFAGPWSSTQDFSIVALPHLRGPIVAASDGRPIFYWDPVQTASRYDIWIDDLTSAQSAVLRNQNVSGTVWTATTPLVSGHQYRWWVRAIDAAGSAGPWSSPNEFLLDTSAPVSRTIDATPTFTWDSIVGAAGYDLWVDDVTAARWQVIRRPSLTENSYTTTSAEKLALGHTYRWWVRALLSGGGTGPWLPYREFTLDPALAPQPVDVGVTAVNPSPTLFWLPITGASRYEAWIDDATTGQQQVVRVTNIGGLSFTVPTPLTSGHRYRWWVRGHSDSGDVGAWSQAAEFTVTMGETPAPSSEPPRSIQEFPGELPPDLFDWATGPWKPDGLMAQGMGSVSGTEDPDESAGRESFDPELVDRLFSQGEPILPTRPQPPEITPESEVWSAEAIDSVFERDGRWLGLSAAGGVPLLAARRWRRRSFRASL